MKKPQALFLKPKKVVELKRPRKWNPTVLLRDNIGSLSVAGNGGRTAPLAQRESAKETATSRNPITTRLMVKSLIRFLASGAGIQ